MKPLKTIFILFLGCSFCFAKAQNFNLPLNYEYNNRLECMLNDSNRVHTAVKPYNQIEVFNAMDSANLDAVGFDLNTNKKKFKIGITKGDFLTIQSKKIYLSINPIIDILGGYNSNSKDIKYTAGFGGQLNFAVGKKFAISATYQGIYEKAPQQVADYANKYGVLTGYRKANVDSNSITSQMISGYMSISPSKYFNIQIGNDKQFFGDGYRSMMMSDNASNAPYFRLTTNFWRVKYVYLLNVMRYGTIDGYNVDNTTKNFKTKYGSFHYLSVDIAKWMQFGFFEGVTWFHADSSKTRGLELNYLNPIAFIRPVEFALGSPDNVVLGLNLKFKPAKDHSLYMQVVLDDMDVAAARKQKGFYRTKVAAQIGYKKFNAFKVKHLTIQSEINVVRPYVFAHKDPAQNYTNFNQSLTHPLGANFWENVSIVNYWNKHWNVTFKSTFAQQGRDATFQHNGSNIFISDYLISPNLNFAYGANFLKGIKTNITNLELRGGYLLNPKLNLSADVIVQYRTVKSSIEDYKNVFIGIGLRTNLFNRYNDF